MDNQALRGLLIQTENDIGGVGMDIFDKWRTINVKYYGEVKVRAGYSGVGGKHRFVIQHGNDMSKSVAADSNIPEFLDLIRVAVPGLIDKLMLQVEVLTRALRRPQDELWKD